MLKAASILLLAALFLLTGEPTANAQAKACVHYDEGGLATTAFGVPEYEATWRELTTEAYTICYTPAESSRTINTIKAILDRANASIEARYTLKSVEPVIYILPDLRPDLGAAPWVSTNFSVGDDVWMVYLSPAHPEWDTWGGGLLRQAIDDYHIRVLSGEYFEMVHDIEAPVPKWVQQGFTWYNGLFHFLDEDETAPALTGLVNNDPEHEVFKVVRKDGVQSFGTNSVYAGGSAILAYLEGRFAGILNELIAHRHPSFDMAVARIIDAKGSTVEDEVAGLWAWIEGCANGNCDIPPFSITTKAPVPTPTPAPCLAEQARRAYYSQFTPPLPGPLSYWDYLIVYAKARPTASPDCGPAFGGA